MADIFISYKTEDRARVAPLVDALMAEGLSVWWDVHIEGGVTWRDSIERELEGAACVIVVWSAGSVGAHGHFVQDEASRGQRRGVCLPVAIDAVEPPLGFGQHQVLNLVGWRGGRRDPRFLDVLAAARALIAREPRPRRAAFIAPTRRRLGARIALMAATTAILVTGAALWLLHGQVPGLGPSAPADSLAVLPFANLSGDAAQDYFSDGLSEELIGALARLKRLHVAGRTSSFHFKGSHEDSATIGGKLGVAWLLDGSVRRDGGLVRISAELADAKTGYERWSATYDRDLKDIFAVQSGIAQAVAEALKVQLFGGDVAALSLNGTSSPEAYDAYLRGRKLLEDGAGEAGYRDALARFDAAIAIDPRYAAAYAGRASALVYLANQFVAPDRLRQTFDEALASARQGVELAPGLAATQSILAATLIYANHDYAGARQAFARAEADGAGDAAVLLGYGLFTCEMGDCNAGAAALRRAAALDPLNPQAYKTLGSVLIGARRYPDAVAALRRALALSPQAAIVHGWIGDALMLQGDLAGARQEYALEPMAWARRTGQAIVLRRLGDDAGARAALAALIADGGEGSAYQEAQIYAQWSDRDRAFAALDAALRLNDPGLAKLKMDPLLDPLRSDPRFAGRLARTGLPG